MTDAQVKKLYKKYKTPLHIIGHCKQVEHVARKIANAYEKKGIALDVENLKYACLLHDILKMEPDHHIVAYKMLMSINEPVIAMMIKKHSFDGIVDVNNQPFTLEEKIMTYADKRVLHENIVSMKRRFEDGKIRYNPNNKNPELEQKIYNAYFQLEKELFASLDIRPEDIK